MTNYAGIHLPSGCEVSVGDDVDSLQDVGVIPMETDSNIEISYEKKEVQGSKRENVITFITNMKAKAATELYQIRMNVLRELTGGAMTVANVAGEAVTGATHTIASGWKSGQLYVLPKQNSNGTAQTITSVVGSSSGALVADDDYFTARDASGAWGVVLRTDGTNTAAVSESVVVTYGYTPAAHIKVDMGSSVVEITKKIVRFKKIQDGKMFQVTLFAAAMSNGIKLSFPGSDEEKPVSIPVELEGSLDTTRASGSQLLEIIDEIGA